ncbi:MAG: hypothetical protein MUP71_03395 [Candidatus Aminicenantes bacterium]|nr:hypothetical protein [Candidatus Aminicenantes bacterium]
MDEHIKDEIAKLKEYFRGRKDSLAGLEELAGAPIRHHFPVDLWQLSDSELDGEMGKRLSFLNDDIDCRPTPDITSHRRFIGPAIVWLKKVVFRIFRPYSNTLFLRQNRFNDQLVAFHLATFIRLRRLEEKVRNLERQEQELREQVEDLPRVQGSPTPKHEAD